MFCTRLANGGLFPTGDPIVPFVISPRFECLNKRTHTHRQTRSQQQSGGYTGSLVSVEKCKSVKQDEISRRDLKNIEHTAAEEILRNHLSSSTPISRTTTLTGRQPNSSHLHVSVSTHGIPDTSERTSKFSSTTSVSSSAIFGDPYYGPKDLLYPKSTATQTEGSPIS